MRLPYAARVDGAQVARVGGAAVMARGRCLVARHAGAARKTQTERELRIRNNYAKRTTIASLGGEYLSGPFF